MKKVLFSAALFFTACAVSAQESVVKEAKSAKSDPVKAAQIIEPALTDPSTANDPETWKLAGDFQKSIYDDENMKLYCRVVRLIPLNCITAWLKCSNTTQSVTK